VLVCHVVITVQKFMITAFEWFSVISLLLSVGLEGTNLKCVCLLWLQFVFTKTELKLSTSAVIHKK
jgi:hypothetical protein